MSGRRRFLDLFVVAVDPRCNQRSPSGRLDERGRPATTWSRPGPSERTGAHQGVSQCRLDHGRLPQSATTLDEPTLRQHSINTPRAGYAADPSPYATTVKNALFSWVFVVVVVAGKSGE